MERKVISAEQMEEQREYASRAKALLTGRAAAQKAYIKTYGCQMNEHDSKMLAGFLGWMGYEMTEDPAQAGLILLNTCCVRAGAEEKVYGLLGRYKKLHLKNPDLIICICGCMMQQDGVGEQLLKRYPYVNLVFGTHSLHRFCELLAQALASDKQVLAVEADKAAVVIEQGPRAGETGPSAYVNIMFGCNNYCSYCVVPYVRGRERSRDPQEILREMRALHGAGVQDVTLLGQNVNSYGKDLSGAPFAWLLRQADEIGIPRIRFMTSHPKDLSDDVLRVMAEDKHIERHIHLPVQCGSDRVLAAMNRGYTRADYLAIIHKARDLMPDIGFTSDMIVGFPGETDEDFEQTLDLVRQVRYDGLYTFKYSRRKGTPAYSMPDQVPNDVKKERIVRLIALQNAITMELHEGFLDTCQQVLVEGVSKHGSDVSGRISRGITVNLPGTQADVGRMIDVRITKAKKNTLYGERIQT